MALDVTLKPIVEEERREILKSGERECVCASHLTQRFYRLSLGLPFSLTVVQGVV